MKSKGEGKENEQMYFDARLVGNLKLECKEKKKGGTKQPKRNEKRNYRCLIGYVTQRDQEKERDR